MSDRLRHSDLLSHRRTVCSTETFHYNNSSKPDVSVLVLNILVLVIKIFDAVFHLLPQQVLLHQ